MTHSSFRDGGLGEFADALGGTAQDHDFQTILMVQMDVQSREHQVVMLMLGMRQATRQFPLMVIIDIGEGSDRMVGGAFSQTVLFEAVAQQVADRFRAIFISLAFDIAIEFLQQRFIQGNCDSFHLLISLLDVTPLYAPPGQTKACSIIERRFRGGTLPFFLA